MEVELIELGKPAPIALRPLHQKPLVSSLLAGLQPVLRSYVVIKDNGREGEKVTGVGENLSIGKNDRRGMKHGARGLSASRHNALASYNF